MDNFTSAILNAAVREISLRIRQRFPEDGPVRYVASKVVDGQTVPDRIQIMVRYSELISIDVLHDSTVEIQSFQWNADGSGYNMITKAIIPLADPHCFDKVLEHYTAVRAESDEINKIL